MYFIGNNKKSQYLCFSDFFHDNLIVFFWIIFYNDNANIQMRRISKNMKHIQKMKLLFVVAILCSIWTITTFAYTVPEIVHIGLSNIGSAITLSNKTITIGAEENGVYVSGGILQSDKGFTFAAGSGTYGAITQYYDSYEAAKQQANTIKNALPAYTGGGKWQLYVSGMTGDQLRQKTGLPTENVASVSNMILIQTNGKTIALTNNITPQFGAANSDDNIITINNKQYRGKIQPTRVNGGSIVPVNAVSIEDYLYGVIPCEMSPSYAPEALKAQAVAARTYAVKKIDMKVHTEKGYDLCDGTHCQAYKGKEAEYPETNSAVDITKGLLIYYEGEPIESVFFASSGGYTENSEDIWTAPLPYLKAVPDVYEVDTNIWKKQFTAAQLTNLTSAKGDNIGQVTDLVISKISLGGRVQELKIVGTKGTKVLTKLQISSYLSGIPTKMFTINGKGSGAKTTVTMNVAQSATPITTPVMTAPETTTPNVNIPSMTEDSIADNYVIGSDIQAVANLQSFHAETNTIGNTSVVMPQTTLPDISMIPTTLPDFNTPDTTTSNITSPATKAQNVTVTAASTGAISTNNGTGVFIIEGKGNGHGAGMSQKGAQGMALQGNDFLTILHHYYTNVTIQ